MIITWHDIYIPGLCIIAGLYLTVLVLCVAIYFGTVRDRHATYNPWI
jgi:hypothetical protein